ncbi:pseudouridine synthase [Myxococcota bacterium]|nr:pseudouridine synthase [Myxococcota bacterium]MBU1430493.1 pseudouridine synthase [Myxococcota bacterium]MBU1899083.1 pseudouridine synthase [Myxococcota bacterium]
MRLDKLLSERGLGTRKQLRGWIKRGRVSVNGEVTHDPGHQISGDEALTFDGAPLTPPPPILLYHKPLGVHSTLKDPQGRACLDDICATHPLYHPVGRLDAETEGLLLLSLDGALTQRLLHPRRAVAREYIAEVHREVEPELPARLAAGVQTAEGTFTAEVVEMAGRRVRLIVREGRHRMVRRMLHNAGWSVEGLRRVRYGAFQLGALPVGEARPLDEAEAAWLAALMSGASEA